jgi:hypothetical protein
MIIVCEGKKTEPNYFKNFKSRNTNLEVLPVTCKRKDIANIIKFAKDKSRELDIDGGDLIWCVFDRDENSDEDIANSCKKAGKKIKMCLSNPSFEIWFLLHYQYNESPITNESLVQKLKNYIPDYHKSSDYYDELAPYTEEAIKNAKRLNDLHKNTHVNLYSTASNPSTQVFKIIEEIQHFNSNT